MPGTTIYHARWLFPVSAAPISGGAVEIDGEGRISALYRRPPRNSIHCGNVAILPGFVNAHVHLEFSDLEHPLSSPRPFSAWVRELLEYRRCRGPADEAIATGLDECRRRATAAVGDIATTDWMDRIPRPPIETVAFKEVIGLDPRRIALQVNQAREFLAAQTNDPRGIHRGLSPHAPYSVHPALLEMLVELAQETNAPLAMHLAETPAELELLRTRSGDLVELLEGLGVWQPDLFQTPQRPLDILRRLASAPRILLAHGNYLDREEIAFLGENANFAVVYCPRTHAYFGHRQHPWQEMHRRGVLIALGTDGRCSNPDLGIWNEVLFLRAQFPGCDPALLLEMATRNGARALGLDLQLGTLEPGKRAQLAMIRLADATQDDPYRALFDERSCLAPFQWQDLADRD